MYYIVLRNGKLWTDYIKSFEDAEAHVAECMWENQDREENYKIIEMNKED